MYEAKIIRQRALSHRKILCRLFCLIVEFSQWRSKPRISKDEKSKSILWRVLVKLRKRVIDSVSWNLHRVDKLSSDPVSLIRDQADRTKDLLDIHCTFAKRIYRVNKNFSLFTRFFIRSQPLWHLVNVTALIKWFTKRYLLLSGKEVWSNFQRKNNRLEEAASKQGA